MKLVKLIMPSQGDMEIVEQEGGTVLLRPTFFGGECVGPVIQIVETPEDGGVVVKRDVEVDCSPYVVASYRIRIKKDGDVKLAKAD